MQIVSRRSLSRPRHKRLLGSSMPPPILLASLQGHFIPLSEDRACLDGSDGVDPFQPAGDLTPDGFRRS